MPITMKYDAAPGTIAGAAHAIGRQAGYNRGMRQWLDFQQVRTQQDAATARDKYYTEQQQLEREKFGFDREQFEAQERRLFEQEQQQRQNDPQWDMELSPDAQKQLAQLDAADAKMATDPNFDDDQRREYARQSAARRRELIRTAQRRKPAPTAEEEMAQNYRTTPDGHQLWRQPDGRWIQLRPGKEPDPAKAQTQRISVIEKRAKLASDRLQARMDRDAAIAAARENTPVKDGWFSDDSSAQDEAVRRVNDYYDELEQQYKALDDELAAQLGPAAGDPPPTAAPPAVATAPGTPAPAQPPTAPSRPNTAPQPPPMGDVPDDTILATLTPVQRNLTERGRGKWEDLPPERQRQLRAEFDALPPEQQEAARAIRKAWDENPALADAWFNDLEGRRQQQPQAAQPNQSAKQLSDFMKLRGMDDIDTITPERQQEIKQAYDALSPEQRQQAQEWFNALWEQKQEQRAEAGAAMQKAFMEVDRWERELQAAEARLAEARKLKPEDYFPGLGNPYKNTAGLEKVVAAIKVKLEAARKEAVRVRHDLPPELQARLADAELVEGSTPKLPKGPEGDRLYAVLPSGWVFIDPEGNRRIKP